MTGEFRWVTASAAAAANPSNAITDARRWVPDGIQASRAATATPAAVETAPPIRAPSWSPRGPKAFPRMEPATAPKPATNQTVNKTAEGFTDYFRGTVLVR